MTISHLVVVGASLAGLRAVEAARKAGFEGSITLIGAEAHLPYDRPPLSKAFLEAGDEPEHPRFRSEEVLRDDLGVELMLGTPATGLDPIRKVVRAGGREVPYDALVIATGSNLRTIPGTEHLAGVHGLRTLDVTVVEALPTPLVARNRQPDGRGDRLASRAQWHASSLRPTVVSIQGEDRVERVVLDDGTILPADLVVLGIGVVPATAWLESSGLELNNGVVCDETLWAGVPGVYAVGDVASWHNPVMGQRQRMENWTVAAAQGAVAARNAIDPENAKPQGAVPYFWSDWYDVRIQFVGSPDSVEVALVDGDPEVGGVGWRCIAEVTALSAH